MHVSVLIQNIMSNMLFESKYFRPIIGDVIYECVSVYFFHFQFCIVVAIWIMYYYYDGTLREI